MSAPHGYDLPEWSCVNTAVNIFNKNLKAKMKRFHYAKVIDINLSRGHFTRHGLHMNRYGKQEIAKMIAEEINSISRDQEPVLPLGYIQTEHEEVCDLHGSGISTSGNCKDLDNERPTEGNPAPAPEGPTTRASTRTRRPPLKMTNFL
ncbi:hypothetical protein C0J52_26058 [Blattella germanica]|nr:hypothetical protein C0J52_26058 [Blattella germanica]